MFTGCFATYGTIGSIAMGVLSYTAKQATKEGGEPDKWTTTQQLQLKTAALLAMFLALFVGLALRSSHGKR